MPTSRSRQISFFTEAHFTRQDLVPLILRKQTLSLFTTFLQRILPVRRPPRLSCFLADGLGRPSLRPPLSLVSVRLTCNSLFCLRLSRRRRIEESGALRGRALTGTIWGPVQYRDIIPFLCLTYLGLFFRIQNQTESTAKERNLR